MQNTETLKAKVKKAPRTPGCYLFYDRFGHIIYVGKSKQLNHRVGSYFQESAQKDERIVDLIRTICDVSYLQTDTELDALIQEYLLIKKHKPFFNSQHIRSYRPHYLEIQQVDGFPVLSEAEEVHLDGHMYLGPFRDGYKVQEVVELLNQVLHTPLCGKAFWPDGQRSCLHHEMGKCYAPCCGSPGVAVYPYAAKLAAFLEGRAEVVLEQLSKDMLAAASEQRYEEALAIKSTMERMTILARKTEFGFAITPQTHAILMMRGYGEQGFSVFYIQQGQVKTRVQFHEGISEAELTTAFMEVIQKSENGEAENKMMSACLQEISAHKRFSLLPATLEDCGFAPILTDLYARFRE